MNEPVKTYAPLPEGTRVRLLVEYDTAKPGTLGTITWKHPTHLDGNPTGFLEMPYRVLFDDHGVKSGEVYFGMSDIGWLVREDEIEVVE